MVPVFKNGGERSTLKNTALLPVNLLSVIERVVSNRLVDHLVNHGLFLISNFS